MRFRELKLDGGPIAEQSGEYEGSFRLTLRSSRSFIPRPQLDLLLVDFSLVKPPILLITFKRSDLAVGLIDTLRSYAPSKVYLASDGFREDQPGEKDLVLETRRLLRESIDWPCEVIEMFQTHNLGLARHVTTAIDSVLNREDRVVVLEDDCFPHLDFFGYCEDLLEKYAHDKRVWCILGDNSGKVPLRGNASYGFVKYSLPVWGIAIWKRSWELFDRDLDKWVTIRETRVPRRLWPSKKERVLMHKLLDKVRFVNRHGWAYSWMFSMQLNGGVAIIPRVNLISNRGHNRSDATHTKGSSLRANFPTRQILPLIHPRQIRRDYRAERLARNGRLFGLKKQSPAYRLAKKGKKTLRAFLRAINRT